MQVRSIKGKSKIAHGYGQPAMEHRRKLEKQHPSLTTYTL
jgi:hypothetical protein